MESNDPSSEVIADLKSVFQSQKQAFLKDSFPSSEQRKDRLRRLEEILVQNQKLWIDAIYEDFDGRPPIQTRMEIYSTLASIRYNLKHLKRWMKPSRRPVPWVQRLMGHRAEVFCQPKGVVGIISPWNFPIYLSVGILANVMSAGNRAVVKPSEFSPETSRLTAELFKQAFSPDELYAVLGESDIGQTFTQLPFDHLIFTGAPSIARHVMRGASENLVPVTLELGGKCPVIIGPEANLDLAVDRIMWGKTHNAGQICLAPDYVFVPKGEEERFISIAREKIEKWFKDIGDTEQYCPIINSRHADRLNGYILEGKKAGVRIEQIGNTNHAGASDRRIPVTVFLNPPEHLLVMRDEVFGPILSIKMYGDIQETIDFINRRPRALALYYFGSNRENIDRIKRRTISGGITVNDIAGHAAVESMPFGGVGNSGMGYYHGYDGFLTFSHQKAILSQGRYSLGKLFNPPYGKKHSRLLDKVIGSSM